MPFPFWLYYSGFTVFDILPSMGIPTIVFPTTSVGSCCWQPYTALFTSHALRLCPSLVNTDIKQSQEHYCFFTVTAFRGHRRELVRTYWPFRRIRLSSSIVSASMLLSMFRPPEPFQSVFPSIAALVCIAPWVFCLSLLSALDFNVANPVCQAPKCFERTLPYYKQFPCLFWISTKINLIL